MLTQDQLKEVLHYCPETGVFTWRYDRRYYKAGDVAGWERSKRGKCYLQIYLRGTSYDAHRLVFLYMTGSFPLNQVDHKDGNGLNNRWLNLRDVIHANNQKNLRLYANNKSGVSGLFWLERSRKWLVQIQHNKTRIHIGLFADKEAAITARKAAEIQYGFHPNHGTKRKL